MQYKLQRYRRSRGSAGIANFRTKGGRNHADSPQTKALAVRLASDFVGKYTIPFVIASPEMPSTMQRREIYYSGRVQGVGFRYTAQRIAQQYEVCGFVHNLPDGRVHMIVEGQPTELDDFLKDLNNSMAAYVRDSVVNQREGTGEFSGFEIRH